MTSGARGEREKERAQGLNTRREPPLETHRSCRGRAALVASWDISGGFGIWAAEFFVFFNFLLLAALWDCPDFFLYIAVSMTILGFWTFDELALPGGVMESK